MALSLDGTTGISASGNITGGNVIASGTLIVGSFTPASVSAAGNVTGGNLLTAGIVSATGNITGSYILGNGSQLTGVNATQIINGTSNAKVVSSGGNIAVGIGGTANVAVFATTGAYITGVTSASGNITGGNLLTAGIISATGAITSASNLSLTGNIIDGGELWINTSSNGNINLNPNGAGQTNIPVGILNVTSNIQGGNLRTAGLISATGAITGAAITGSSLTVSTGTVTLGNIVNANGNGVGNIGSSSVYFNTVFGKATTAQYADLAELYSADTKYEPGTVLVFGGNNEVTISTIEADPRVAGVVSTNPAHLMNSTLDSEHTVAVALTGRVPTKVIGTVRKGDMMVTAGNGVAQASAAPTMGTVIGKALENFDGVSGVIEIVVGRL